MIDIALVIGLAYVFWFSMSEIRALAKVAQDCDRTLAQDIDKLRNDLEELQRKAPGGE